MPPPREVPRKLPKASSTSRWERMRIGRCWSPYSSSPIQRASQPMAESLTPYRDTVLSAPRSMTGMTRPVSTGASVRTRGPVRTDPESAQTVITVRADSRPAWTEQPVKAGQEQPPTTPVWGWSRLVALAGQTGSGQAKFSTGRARPVWRMAPMPPSGPTGR